MNIEETILNAIDSKIKLDQTIKLVHEFKADGEPCSKDKSPALSVTRTYNGWLYNCHRCGEKGFIRGEQKTPSRIKERVEEVKRVKPEFGALPKAVLPFDYQPLMQCQQAGVPLCIHQWLWRYAFTQQVLEHYRVGYSKMYNRIIFPIYNYKPSIQIGERKLRSWVCGPDVPPAVDSELIGWTGRCVESLSKRERADKRQAKWLTRKDGRLARLFYHLPSIENKIVIVEDVVSAIKIHRYLGWNAVALMTTYLDDELQRMLRGYDVHIWLDSDMTQKSIGYVQRLNTLGIHAKFVETQSDPKEYGKEFITNVLKGDKK